MLCWRAPSPPRIRYKILPARCCANQSGTKLSLHAEKAPNRAISGEQGEFCTGHAVRRGVRGEFCTGGARCGCCWASCVVLWRSPCASWRAMAVPRRHPRALRPGPPAPPAPSAPVGLNRWWVVHGRAYVCTREKVRPARSGVGVSAKKFALCAHNTPNSAFLRVLGEFFRGRAAGGAVLGEFFRANRPCTGLGGDAAHFGLAAVGVLHYTKPSCGVSPACRTPV